MVQESDEVHSYEEKKNRMGLVDSIVVVFILDLDKTEIEDASYL